MSSDFILAIVFLVLALSGVSIKKTYFDLPLKEIRQKSNGNTKAIKELEKALGYGVALRGLLWLYIGLTLASSLVLLARSTPIWLSIILIAFIIFVIFSILPNRRITRWSRRLTRLLTPTINFILGYTHKYIASVYNFIAKYYHPKHTGIFDSIDFLSFITTQAAQKDNHISPETLVSIERAVSFSNKKIKHAMLPLKKAKLLKETDIIGPILINELHESGQEHILVKDSAGNIAGTLAVSTLGIKSEGRVADFMDPTVYYLNEDNLLYSVIRAFFKTNQTTYVVINEDQASVGVITLQTAIKHLTGSLKSLNFDDYTNPEAVASMFASVQQSTKTDEEMVK